MGASVLYRVRVLRTYEDVIDVSAVTSMEAEAEAAACPGVVHVLGVIHEDEYIYGVTSKGSEQ